MSQIRPSNPQQAWDELVAGNHRFVTGDLAHVRQDIDHVEALAAGQRPFAALFGCADSRLSAEIIFDVGLGDLFVVRNAGQVIGESILGSLEYSVEVLGVPLIIVLGHDECGAIRATIDATEGKLQAQGHYIKTIVSQIEPTVHEANKRGLHHIDDVTALHIEETINEMITKSEIIADAVSNGKVGIVGANYKLALGEIHPLFVVGEVNK